MALNYGNVCGALNTLGHGAIDHLPTREEIARWLWTHRLWKDLKFLVRNAGRRRWQVDWLQMCDGGSAARAYQKVNEGGIANQSFLSKRWQKCRVSFKACKYLCYICYRQGFGKSFLLAGSSLLRWDVPMKSNIKTFNKSKWKSGYNYPRPWQRTSRAGILSDKKFLVSLL